MALLLGANMATPGEAYAQSALSIERVSIGDSGQQVSPDDPTVARVRVSFDGDRVLFGTFERLVADDRNGTGDGYVRIRSSQTTERVTLQADGSELVVQPFGLRVWDMSSNGQFVAFTVTEARPSGTFRELFVRDVVTGETGLIAASNTFGLSDAVVSDDGNIVAFVSKPDLLPGGRGGNGDDVYVHDRSTGETIRLRVPGVPRWWGGSEPDITPDGRYVVYRAWRSIYRADLRTGEYELVSVNLDPRSSVPDEADDPMISADGRFVVYLRSDFILQILLRDMNRERPVLVSAGPGGGVANANSSNPSISADGRLVLFASRATDLGPDVGDGDSTVYLYLFDRADGSISLVSRDEQGKPIAAVSGVGGFAEAQISGDGSTVVFASSLPDLVAGDTNDARDVFAISLEVERCAGEIVTIAGSGQIFGTDGADVILASAGPDTIRAGAGDDIICALGGDDLVYAGRGNDRVEGGPGDDIIRGGGGDDELRGQAGDDWIMGNPGADRILGGAGVDEIDGGAGADILFPGPGGTVGSGVAVKGGSGDDIVYGGPNADDIRGNDGDDRLFGREGGDRINGGPGDDWIRGGAGADVLNGGSGADVVGGGGGDDVVRGDLGDDAVLGGEGRDSVEGGGGADVLVGGGSSGDVCRGQGGVDVATSSCERTFGVP